MQGQHTPSLQPNSLQHWTQHPFISEALPSEQAISICEQVLAQHHCELPPSSPKVALAIPKKFAGAGGAGRRPMLSGRLVFWGQFRAFFPTDDAVGPSDGAVLAFCVPNISTVEANESVIAAAINDAAKFRCVWDNPFFIDIQILLCVLGILHSSIAQF